MFDNIILIFGVIVFIYLLYQQYKFQKNLLFPSVIKENFTPLDVNRIIQQPNSIPIGTTDKKILEATQLTVISNGYNSKTIDNLKASNPEPYKETDSEHSMGDFPNVLKEKYPLPTTEFEYPNKYNFTVNYDCRKSATGMFSDCGVYSANNAWTADPYKGLNCPLNNTKTPKQSNDVSRGREIEYTSTRKTGFSGVGNSMLR